MSGSRKKLRDDGFVGGTTEIRIAHWLANLLRDKEINNNGGKIQHV